MEKIKKSLNPIIQLFSISWILYVVYKYFYYHPEYFGDLYETGKGVTSAFVLTPHIWKFLAIFGGFYVFWVLYQSTFKEKEKIEFKTMTPVKVLGIFSLFLIIFAAFWFLASGFSKQTEFISSQISIITKLSTIYLTLFSLSLVSFSAGKKILNLAKFNFNNKLADTLTSIGIGLGVIMLGIFFLGTMHQIKILPVSLFFIAILVICYREIVVFLKRFFLETFEFEARYFSFKIFFLFALSFVLIMNAIDLIRPMPIGWDDMGVYLNFPKLVAGNHELLKGTTNNYFLIASLPFVFFQNEYLAAMNGMFISFWGGLLMIFALIAFMQKFFDKKYGLMVAAMMYAIPMTMHQSYADMKTDMMLFFFMILCVYQFYKWFTTQEKKWLILAGVFAGIAFGIKPTAILLIFGILIGIAYKLWKWQGALAIFLFEWIILRYSGTLRFVREFNPNIILGGVIVLLVLTIVFFVLAAKKHKQVRIAVISIIIFTCSTGFVFAPWAIKNIGEHNYKISIGSILNGKATDKPILNAKAVGVDTSSCKGTARIEELDRYLGYDKGISRYLTLPWKVTMNTTVHGFYLDLSFLFLAFAPLGLLIFCFFRKDINAEKRKLWTTLIIMGAASWSMWIFVGNGVIWYGIFGFILLLPLSAFFFYENNTPALKIVCGTMVILSLFTVIALRGTKFGNLSTIRYAYGITNGLQTVDAIVPDYRKISCKVTGGTWNINEKTCLEAEKKEHSSVYRIGTFIAYFIPENNRRIFNDPQLDNFTCIDNAFGNDDLTTMKKFQELGYKYFILDLNTATIEHNPNGTLHQKANRFVEWANSLSKKMKMYVHVYNPKKGIAFMEITDEESIEIKD